MAMNKIIVDYNPSKSRFEITVPFVMNGVAQAMPSRRWNKSLRKWVAPLVKRNVEYIMNNIAIMSCAEITPAAQEAIINHKQRQQKKAIRKFPEWYQHKLPPRKHQLPPLDKFYGAEYGGLFYPVGTGKSKIAIDLTAAKAMSGDDIGIDAAVILCPYSIRKNWLKQLEEHCPIGYVARVLDYQTVKGRKEFQELLSETDKMRYLIVGIESLSSGSAKEFVYNFLTATKSALIVDEAQRIKNPNAKRTKVCMQLAKYSKFRLIMTGTPITQGIIDLYSQMQFLSPDIIGIGDYYSFRNRYAVMGGYNNKEIIGYRNVDELMEAIRPHICQVTREEALKDLPESSYIVRTVPMTKEQREVYRSVASNRLIVVDESEITVENALAQLTRLQQIAGGFTVKEGKDPITQERTVVPHFLGSNKVDEVVSIAEEVGKGTNIIVWCRFIPEIKLVAGKLREIFGGDQVVEFHGEIEDSERWNNLQKFERREVQFFVANPRLGGIGLDILAGDIAIFYSNTFSYEDRVQAEGRNLRTGRKKPVTYIDLVCEKTVDEHVLDIIKAKGTMAAYVRDALRQGVNPIKEIGEVE